LLLEPVAVNVLHSERQGIKPRKPARFLTPERNQSPSRITDPEESEGCIDLWHDGKSLSPLLLPKKQWQEAVMP
jgi:hypothetical protein